MSKNKTLSAAKSAKSVSFVRTAGQSGSFRVRSVLGEDEEEITHHDCEFIPNASTNHVPAPSVCAVPAMERMVAMYALPQTNALVSAAASVLRTAKKETGEVLV